MGDGLEQELIRLPGTVNVYAAVHGGDSLRSPDVIQVAVRYEDKFRNNVMIINQVPDFLRRSARIYDRAIERVPVINYRAVLEKGVDLTAVIREL